MQRAIITLRMLCMLWFLWPFWFVLLGFVGFISLFDFCRFVFFFGFIFDVVMWIYMLDCKGPSSTTQGLLKGKNGSGRQKTLQ